MWCPKRLKWVYRTKLAQEYPWLLCRRMAAHVAVLFQGGLPQFAPSFALVSKDVRKAASRPTRSSGKIIDSGWLLWRQSLRAISSREVLWNPSWMWKRSQERLLSGHSPSHILWPQKCNWIKLCNRRSTWWRNLHNKSFSTERPCSRSGSSVLWSCSLRLIVAYVLIQILGCDDCCVDVLMIIHPL